MEWTPPAVRHHGANGGSASQGQARRNPDGEYDHRGGPRKVSVSGSRVGEARTRRPRAAPLDRTFAALLRPAAAGDGRGGGVRVRAPLGTTAAAAGPHRPTLAGPRRGAVRPAQ